MKVFVTIYTFPSTEFDSPLSLEFCCLGMGSSLSCGASRGIQGMIALTLSVPCLRGVYWRHMDAIFLSLTKGILSLGRLQAMCLSSATIIPFDLFQSS